MKAIVLAVALTLAGCGTSSVPTAQSAPSASARPSENSSTASNLPPGPTSAQPQPPADCQKVDQQGVAIFISLSPSGPDPRCMQISGDAAVAVSNDTGSTLTVSLGARGGSVSPGSTTGFDGPVRDFLPVGRNVMHVSAYTPEQYPVIWVS